MRNARAEAALLSEAASLCREVLAGSRDPNKACERLGQICAELDWPESMQMFSLLAHDQQGHEHLGMTAENTVPDIIAACKEFLAIRS